MATPVTDALGLVEDAILGALAAVGSARHWEPAPADTMRRLALPGSDPQALASVVVCHHQDGGGQPAALVGSAGWQGLVTVRAFSRTRATARAALGSAVTALGSITSPSGYRISAMWQRPIVIPRLDPSVYVSAGIWLVTARRSA